MNFLKRTFIAALLLLLAVAPAAQAIGTNSATAVPSLTVGGRVFTDLVNLKVLVGWNCSNTTARYSTVRAYNGGVSGAAPTAGYAVTAGKVLTIEAARILNQQLGASSIGAVVPMYGDNDVGMNSSSAPANIKYMGGDVSTMALENIQTATNLAQTQYVETQIYFQVPATKLPGLASTGTIASFCWTFWLYGYER